MADRLYPPIVNYSMPAFAGQKTRIYFANSDFNNINNIKEVQMTIRYLSNNESALKVIKGAAQIASFTVNIDPERVSQIDKYYIELDDSLLNKEFEIGTIYKIQLRFSSIRERTDSRYRPSATWINQHLMLFSEWSTVCLIRRIDKPVYSILGLEEIGTGASVSFASVDSVFTVSYNQGASSEPLKSWRAILYNENKTEIYADSTWHNYTNYDYLAVDNKNSIAFDIILPYVMISGQNYLLKLFLETRNGYTTSSEYLFTCLPITGLDFIGTITVEMIESEGYANIHVTSANPYSTNLILRRSSSESNFTIWEDINVFVALNTPVDWNFKDFTIESGIWYRYGVQSRDTIGRRGPLKLLSSIELAEFEDAFLLESSGKQLKLKYDFNISSANVVVSESKTDTIGSKYPFVRRNGTMYYRTFQCSGLITGYMDADAHLFINDAEIYNNNQDRYNQIRTIINKEVNQYDYTYEREFREKVQEFLYDNQIKLFKSLQEGNILVKLMNVTLTPKNELGRLLYSFSAQAIEIDEPKLNIFQNYGFQSLDEYASSITFDNLTIGQLSSFVGNEDLNLVQVYNANENIIQYIGEKYGWRYNGNNVAEKIAKNNLIVNDFQIKYLRVEFESDPYLIIKNGNNIMPLEDSMITTNQSLVYGWIINIDGVPILVQMPNNIYEIKEENFLLSSNSSISFPKDTQATIYYTSAINQEVDPSLTPISIQYKKILGQLNTIFKPDSIQGSVLLILQRKYALTAGKTQVSLDSLLWADIEAEPGTIFYARSSASEIPTKFVIDETGNYLLQPNITAAKIDTLYFSGQQIDIRYLYPEYKWKETLPDGEDISHYNTENSINQFVLKHNKGSQTPIAPQQYDYYLDNGILKMFFNKDWYPCTIDINYPYLYEIQCPVRAMINYEIQRREGVYQ